MKNVNNIVSKVRLHLLKQDSLLGVFYIIIFYSIFFLIYVQLESIFYFLPKIKINIFIFLISSFSCFLLLFIIQYFRAINGKIKKYKTKQISISLGKKLYPAKKDKILNALQIESSINKNESQELAKSFIEKVSNELTHLDLFILFKDKRLITIKQILLIFLILIIFVFSIRYDNSKYAFNRLINPKKEFFAPKPFILSNLTGNIHILGGEIADIEIVAINATPDTILLELEPIQESTKSRDSLKLEYEATSDSNNIYKFTLPKLYQDYSYRAIVKAKYFWEAWNQVNSEFDTIYVTDRPEIENFRMIISPPKYSKLSKREQEGNLAVVEALKGSRINIDLTSNRNLESAHIAFIKEKINMITLNKKASGYFDILKENTFKINLVDERGITNRDPISYKIQFLPDQFPELYVNEPKTDIELGTDQIIIFNLELQDDYGFNSLQLAYEVHRPSYLKTEPFVSMKTIEELKKDSLVQIIQTFWELDELNLMPQDEVHFHFELTDNDNISGPKKTISKKFIARVPSLADLYAKTETSENDFARNLENELNEIDKLKQEWENLELETLKSSELNWEQKESIKNTLEKVKSELKRLEEMSDAVETISQQAEKHELFSPELLNKFKELSKLIKEIMPENMLKNMEDLNNALENMNMESLNDAINELANNMEKIKEDIDRYLKVFKRLQAEQKMDELQNRIEKLLKQQESLSEEINQIDQNIEKSITERLKQEEKRILEEFNNIKSLIEDASEITKPFSQQTSNKLQNLEESDISKNSDSSINQTMQSLSNQNISEAKKMSNESIKNLQMMNQKMININKEFQQETVSDMTRKFQALIQDILYLSSQEEKLKSDVKSSSRNSPRLREFASRQQLLQDQLQSITNKMLELSKETFSITPSIGRAIGKANSGMKEAKKNLTDRNINLSYKNQVNAMSGLNESAMELFNSMQNMKKSGSSSGYDQFLQMMQEMAQQQQGVNKKGMQLSLGQLTPSMQNQMMNEMFNQQKTIRKSLEKLMNEMKRSGNQQNSGSLKGIKNEMDKVLKDLKNKKFNKKTKDRSKRILSRMLDSQASMTERGYKEERKSISSNSKYVNEIIGGLPSDLGQRQNLTLEALNDAIKAGYTKEHQTMIKRYFNLLNQIETDINLNNNLNEK